MATNEFPDLYVDPDGMVGHQPRQSAVNVGPAGTLDVLELQGGPEARRAAEAQGAAYLAAHQPAPTGNGTPILPLVVADLTARAEHGRKKYGTVLRAGNGRDALQDALEEAYDQVMYLRQFKEDLPKLLAELRAAALEEAHQLAEAFLHSEPGPGAAKDELDRTAIYSNGTVRRILAGIRGLQGKPPAEPEPVRRRKQHRWEPREKVVEGHPERWWSCRDCPLERNWEANSRGGGCVVYRAGGVVLARGGQATTRVPPCPPAPKGGP